MSKHLKLAAVGCLALVSSVTAHAADKGLSVSGDFVGGFSHDWGGGQTKGNEFFVDNATVKMKFGVSDKVTVYFDNVASMMGQASAGTTNTGSGLNTSNYLNARAQIAGGNYMLSNTAAYLEHQCGENTKVAFGHQAMPFGMESMWDRYDMHSYYYSGARVNAVALGYHYDLGAKVTLNEVLPGTLEFGLWDGRNVANNTQYSPSTNLRWSMTHKSGDWTLTPVISGHFGRWIGGPKDLGITAGFNWKMSALWANLEWVYTSSDATNAGAAAKNMSIYLEPGFDLGAAVVSVKADMNTVTPAGGSGTSDFNLGAAISKTYADKMQIKLAYQHANLSGKNGVHSNDLRFLIGTKW